jgi:hypothetical protein
LEGCSVLGAGVVFHRTVTLAAELGCLDPSSTIGVRLGFAF